MIRRMWGLRRDPLVANSFFITLSNASMGALGFLFWVVATRLFRPDEVGVVSTLISAAILIAYVSLLGFNVSFVRFLPTSEAPSEDINTGLTLVFIAALVVGGGYLTLVPSIVPQLHFLRAHPLETVAIVFFIAFGSVNVVTDAVFIAYRSARYNVLVDGALQGAVRLALPVLFVSLGAFGLMSAYGVASIVAVTASVVLMMRRFSYRPRVHISPAALRRLFRFGASSYLAEMCTMVPVLALPLIVIHDRGSAAAGYFYLAMSVANLLFAATLAVGQSALAEGSNEAATIGDLARRAGRLQLVTVAMALILMAASHTILSVFGPSYASQGTLTLVILLASAPAVSLKHWAVALLRLRHRLRPVVASNLCLAVIPCTVAALTAHRGLVWVAFAWLVGNVAAGVVAGTALFSELRGPRPTTAEDASWGAESALHGRPGRLRRAVVVEQAEEVLVGRDGGAGVAG